MKRFWLLLLTLLAVACDSSTPIGYSLDASSPDAGRKLGGYQPPPSGTGVVKVVAGVQQNPASLIVNADVDPAANIAITKLAPCANGQIPKVSAGAWACDTDATGGGGGSVPTGTGFVHITAGAQDVASRAVDVSTADITGTQGVANGGSGASTFSVGVIHSPGGTGALTSSTIVNADVSSSAAIAVTKLAPGTNGQCLTTTGGVGTWGACGAGGGTPGGANTNVQYNSSGSFGGDASFTYATGVANLATALTVGTNPSSAGALRLANGGDLECRNQANSQNLLGLSCTSANHIVIGSTSQVAGVDIFAASGNIVQGVGGGTGISLSSTLDTHSVPLDIPSGSNYVSIGGAPYSTVGSIRLPHVAGSRIAMAERSAANNADWQIIATNGAGSSETFGDTNLSTTLQGYGLQLTGAVGGVDVYQGGTYGLSVGGAPGGGTPIAVMPALPVIGDERATGTKAAYGVHGAIDVTLNSDQTLTAAQFKYTLIRLVTTTTSGAARTAFLPPPSDTAGSDGYWKMLTFSGDPSASAVIKMTSTSGSVSIGGTNPGRAAIVFVHRGIGVIRITADSATN